jgi:RNA polymerase sigma-70 factor (ECF subfamily)
MSQPKDAEKTQGKENKENNSLDFNDIYEEYRGLIYNYLWRITKNQMQAEDLTQETFIRVHRSLATFRGDSSLKTWLYRIASNVFIDHSRRVSTKQDRVTVAFEETIGVAGDWDDKETPRPDQLVARSEMSACVQEHIKALPESYQTVLVMHDEEGLTTREIAEVLGCSEANAKIRLHRARDKLRASLNAGCNFTHDERNVFICERKAPDEGCGETDCVG